MGIWQGRFAMLFAGEQEDLQQYNTTKFDIKEIRHASHVPDFKY